MTSSKGKELANSGVIMMGRDFNKSPMTKRMLEVQDSMLKKAIVGDQKTPAEEVQDSMLKKAIVGDQKTAAEEVQDSMLKKAIVGDQKTLAEKQTNKEDPSKFVFVTGDYQKFNYQEYMSDESIILKYYIRNSKPGEIRINVCGFAFSKINEFWQGRAMKKDEEERMQFDTQFASDLYKHEDLALFKVICAADFLHAEPLISCLCRHVPRDNEETKKVVGAISFFLH